MSVQIKGVGTISGIDQGLDTVGVVTATSFVGTGVSVVGVITATSFVGSGANLTSLPAQVTIANNADNRVITGGSGTNLNGESGFTYDGSRASIINSSGPILELVTNANAADAALRLSEGTAGSTTNGGGMFYSGQDNKLHITCGTNLTTKRITILRDTGDVGIGTVDPQPGGLTVLNNSETRLQVWANGDGSNGKIALRADGTNTQMGTWSNHDCHLVRNTSIQATISSTGISLPAGKGIDFSASGNAGGMTSELLDDYEEGSFTPTYNNIPGGVTPAYNYQEGRYTKIGNLVTCAGIIGVTNANSFGSGRRIEINLPFTCAANAFGQAGGSIVDGSGWQNVTSNAYQAGTIISGGVSYGRIVTLASSPSSVYYTGTPGLQNTHYFRFRFIYPA